MKDQDRIKQLEAELAEAKANEARLEAMLQDSIAREWPNPTALRDLLEPVVQSLSELRLTCAAAMRVIVAHGAMDDFEQEAIDIACGVGVRAGEQLTRLRALVERKA